MKYIPAEKLIAEIERLKGLLIRGACAAQVTMETNCKDEAYNEVLSFITSLQQEQPEVDKFDCPATPIEEAIEVTSRMQHIDEEMKPIAKFIMDYASWNLHKGEWNQPVIEVPLFRVLDALVQRGKPYCCSG